MTTTTEPVNVAALKGSGSKFRPDIQGLRAIAVGMVLLYHAGISFLPGGFSGVDVFFVISGFLITGMLVRQSLQHGRIYLKDFYSRRIRRILPAATVVILFTALATVFILPRTRWENIAQDLMGSALYVVNWVLADKTDYLNAEVPPSPLQHFWTLAVEEQFYIVWPLLIVVLLFVAQRLVRRRNNGMIDSTNAYTRRAAEIGVFLVIVPSLAWSIYYSAASPAPAFFVTTTRLWELAIGAAIAVYAVYLERVPYTIGRALQIAGLLAVVASAFVLSSETIFPGYAALLPTLGAAGVIIGGMAGRATTGPARLLTARPMVWTGDLSYSLYLWHWPLIIFATFLAGGELPVLYGLLVVALSVVPSWLSYHFVEQPFRHWSFLKAKVNRALSAGVALMLIGVIAGASVLGAVRMSTSNAPENPEDSGLGAAAIESDPSALEVTDTSETILPDPIDANEDRAAASDPSCFVDQEKTELNPCIFGDEDSDYRVVLAGDSHAGQWQPALDKIAQDNGWRLETHTKNACAVNSVALQESGEFYESCYEWNENLMNYLTGPDAPDHVIIGASKHNSYEEAPEGYRTGSRDEGFAASWSQIRENGTDVTVILDTPRPEIDVPECVAENTDNLSSCAYDREEVIGNSGAEGQKRAASEANVNYVDLSDSFCNAQSCPPVIGSVLVYRDDHHITATYAETLAPRLEAALRQSSDVLFEE